MFNNLFKFLFILSTKIFFLCINEISANHLYLENQNVYDLRDYKKNSINSKKYYRNLIAYYINNNQERDELELFLKKQQPEFYWFYKEIYLNTNYDSINPSIRIWFTLKQKVKLNPETYSEHKKNCDFFGDNYCQWIEFLSDVYENNFKTKKLNENDIFHIVNKIYIFTKQKYFIPYMYESAHWLPEFLLKIGLAKESKLLLENMLLQVNSSIKEELLKLYIDSLILSGNFKVILDYILENENYKRDFKKQLENFIKLVYFLEMNDSNKKKIQTLYESIKNFKINDLNNFNLTSLILHARIIEIEFLQKENYADTVKKLQLFLEEKNQSEFEKLFLRLILAKIILSANPSMAQKISEDIQFKAQEKGFYLLEYYATIWNGWSLYLLNKFYESNIEFTKAYSIRIKHFSNISNYSELAGLFLTRKKFNILDRNLLNQIYSQTKNKIPDQKFLMFSEWLPLEISYDFSKESLIDFYLSRKNWNGVFNMILDSYNEKKFLPYTGSLNGIYVSSLIGKLINIPLNYSHKNKTSLRLFQNNYTVIFYPTQNNEYIFLFSKNIKKSWKIPKNSENKDWINEIKNLISKKIQVNFFLNPKSDYTHSKILELLSNKENQNIKFYLISFIKNNYKKIISKNNDCILESTTGNFIIRNIKRFSLQQIECNNTNIDLWDLENFIHNNSTIEYSYFGNDKTFYQILYSLAIQNQWRLREIVNDKFYLIEILSI